MWLEVSIAMALVVTFLSHKSESINNTIPMTTAPPITEFTLNVTHTESSTSSIRLKWEPNIPKWMKVTGYEITASKEGTGAIVTYPKLPGDTLEFEVDDLVRDSNFEVCIRCDILNNTEPVVFLECFDSFTIPYFRPDSVYVLCIVIGYFVLMVLVGWIAWRCAVSKANKKAGEDKGDGDDTSFKHPKHFSEEGRPILLPTPNDELPKASIEDDYQPNMTPPWSRMEMNGRGNSHV